MKLVIVKRDKIGDLLLTTPMLAHLRRSLPQAQIHLLANDYNAWVVQGNRDVDRVWVYPRFRHGGTSRWASAWRQLSQRQAMRRERIDWAIVANGTESPRAIRRALALRPKHCVAYCANATTYHGLTDPLSVNDRLHEVDRILAMLVPLGVDPPITPIEPRYVLPESAATFARSWLAERALSDRGYVVIGLGARRPKKQPNVAQVLRWSAHLRDVWGLQTVFMWTPGRSDDPAYPGDDAVAQAVLQARAAQIHPFRGPILQALGLIWSARTSLFPDSGLMHFAAASLGGVLGFFAETEVSPSPVQWAPRGPRADWLEAQKSVQELPDALVYERIGRLLEA